MSGGTEQAPGGSMHELAGASRYLAQAEADVEPQVFVGAWGRGWDLVMCLLPIVFLILTTVVKQVKLKTSVSLPAAAAMMWVIRLAYLDMDANFTNAAVIYGLFDALTPMSIIAGAICLFNAMEHTHCLDWMIGMIKRLSNHHPVAEVFLISWAFEYMIEGASGFGTPTALAAPMLVSLGHDAVPAVCCCLVMNTLATVYGAVGTPIWFGLDGLGLERSDMLELGFQAQVMLASCAHIVPLLAASFVVSWRDLAASWRFILLSVWSGVLPAMVLARFSTDFSSLAGGIVSLLCTGALSAAQFGLGRHSAHKPVADEEGEEDATAQLRPPLDPSLEMSDAGREETRDMERMNAPLSHPLSMSMPASEQAVAEGVELCRPGGAPGSMRSGGAFPAELFHPRVHKSPAGPVAEAVDGDDRSADGQFGSANGAAGGGEHVRDDAPGAGEGRGVGASARLIGAHPIQPTSMDSESDPEAYGAALRPQAAERPRSDAEPPVGSAGDAGAPGEAGRSETADSVNIALPSELPAAGQPSPGGRQWMASLSGRLQGRGASRTSDGVPSSGSLQYRLLDDRTAAGAAQASAAADSGAQVPSRRRSTAESVLEWTNIAATAAARTMPLWLTVLLLIITRIQPIGVRDFVRAKEPFVTARLGSLFHVNFGAHLVFSIHHILGQEAATLKWTYELLYVPFLLPFVAAAAVTVVVFRKDLPKGRWSMPAPFLEAARRVSGIVPALLGSLVLVSLLRKGETPTSAPAYMIGYNLADFLRGGFIAISGLLGALGSFFSGSTTVSNLTFGVVQQVAAERLNLDPLPLLALQSVGASAGNMICINNIIAAQTVVGGAALEVSEGSYIIRNALPLLVLLTVATVVAVIFLFT